MYALAARLSTSAECHSALIRLSPSSLFKVYARRCGCVRLRVRTERIYGYMYSPGFDVYSNQILE